MKRTRTKRLPQRIVSFLLAVLLVVTDTPIANVLGGGVLAAKVR